jgi:glycosyltransferase involved in cell wall biosynthesis
MFVASGAPTDKMVFCRQGQLTTDSEPAVNQKVASDVLRLTYMGQIAQHKGLHVLVDALNEIPDAPVSLEIYGDTAVNPDYVRSLMEISRNDKRIRFAGTFSRNELTGIMNRTDAVVVPSLWYENSPNVIFEAFAHQVPVVATDLGGMAELVQSGKNGLLFPVGDSAALAQAIQTLVDAPGLLAEMAKHVPTVRSVKQEIDELEALFLDLVARRQSATNRPVEREGLAP